MIKKLFKHELASYMRTWLPIQLIVLGIALLGRFVQFFEADTTAYGIIFGSSVTVYVLSVIVSLVLTSIVCIVRFYKNLFTGEGYLSFTLPVTPAQHILIKMFASLTVEIGSFIVVLASVGIITSGEVFTEIIKALAYISDTAIEASGAHFPLYVIELIVIMITSSLTGTLLVYGCIALGQTFNKSRIGWAVGIYFIYYMIKQILGTVISTVFTLFYDKLPIDNIATWVDSNPYATFHIAFGIAILWNLAAAAIYYAVTYFVIKRKLNLE